MRVNRRALLLGGIAGTTGLASACGVSEGAGTISGRLESGAMEGTVGWAVHYPSGTGPDDHLPVVVSLHGRGGSHSTSFSQLHLDRVVDELHRKGGAAIAVAAVDGGDHGYWHRRTDGTDPAAMIAHEFLPLLRRRGLDTKRLGLFGWSMGGYGALLLAGRRQLRPLAVAVSSPALFTSASATAAGAYDSAADFDRNDIFAHPEWERGIPTRIDIGDRDPFVAATRDYMARLRPPAAGGVHPGSHDADFWRTLGTGPVRLPGKALVMAKLILAIHGGLSRELLLGPGLRSSLAAVGATAIQANVDDDAVAAAMRFGPGEPVTALVSVWTEGAPAAVIAVVRDEAGGVGIDAYRVTERIRLDPAPVPDGTRSDVLAQVALLRRPEGMSRADYLAYWMLEHTPIAIRTQATSAYIQNIVEETLTPGSPELSAIVEEHFPMAGMTDPHAFYGSRGDEAELKRRMTELLASVARFGADTGLDLVPTSRYFWSL